MILRIVLMIVSYPQFFQSLKRIYEFRNTDHFKKVYSPLYLLSQILFFFISFGTFTAMQFYSVDKIWTQYTRSVQMAFSLQFIYICLMLQYSLVIYQQVNPFRRSIVLTWFLIWLNVYNMVTFKRALFDEVQLLYLCMTIQSFCVVNLVYNLQKEFKTILNIAIFTNKKLSRD